MTRTIPLAIPNVGESEGRNLQACIDENMVSSIGRFVTQLEDEVANAVGTSAAVATSSGTTGLHAALHVVGVRRDDLVICPSFTFIASANAINQCGAAPWLMDIDQDWLIDLDQLESCLTALTHLNGGHRIHSPTGRRVAAILPVYCLGNIPDLERLKSISTRYGLPIVADAAAALGATRGGEAFGAVADLSVISFNGNKVVTAGGGGVVTSPSGPLLARVRHVTSTARVSADYAHDEPAFNYRMTNIQAAVGCAQMARLPAFVASKLKIRERYAGAFAALPGQSPFPLTPGGSAWFSGLVLDPARWPSLPDLVSSLKERGVEARPFWKPIHLQQPYADVPSEPLSRTNETWSRILTLPCSTSLSDADQDRVISAVLDVAEEANIR